MATRRRSLLDAAPCALLLLRLLLPSLASLLAWANLAVPVSAQGQPPDVAVCLANNSDAITGSDDELDLSGLFSPFIATADGAVLAEAGLAASGIEISRNSGLVYLHDGDEPELLIRESDPIAGGFYRRTLQVTADAAGNLAVHAVIGDEIFFGNDFNGPTFRALLVGPPDNLQVLTTSKEVDTISFLRHNRAGLVAFYADRAIWTWDGISAEPTRTIQQDVAYPGLPPNSVFSSIGSRLELAADGDILFTANLETIDPLEPDDPSLRRSGLWLFDSEFGGVSLVALEGNAASGVPGFIYTGSFSIHEFSEGGWLVFSGGIDDDDTFPGQTQLFAGTTGSFAPLVGPTDDPFYLSSISDDGHLLAFEFQFGVNTAVWMTPAAVEVSTQDDWIEVARAQNSVPGLDETFTEFTEFYLDSDGTLILGARSFDGFRSLWRIWRRNADDGILRPTVGPGTEYVRNGEQRTLSVFNELHLPTTSENSADASFSPSGGMRVPRNGIFPFVIESNFLGNTSCVAILAPGSAPRSSSATVTMHRVQSNGYSEEVLKAGLDDIDAPLVPLDAPLLLLQQPAIEGGLVADGVTPLLFNANFDALGPDSTFRAELDLSVPGAELQVLEIDGIASRWVRASTQVTVENTGESLFFYLPPIDPQQLPVGQPGLDPTLRLIEISGDSEEVIAELAFSIRRPPVLLRSLSAIRPWAPEFLQAIEARRGPGFAAQGEAGLISLEANWAFTRPDWIVHSSHGLWFAFLTFEFVEDGEFNFRGPANFYRGRWRRCVEMGAVHPNTDRLGVYLASLPPAVSSQLPSLVFRPRRQDTRFNRPNVFASYSQAGLWSDPAAVIHSLTTQIPSDPARVPLYRMIGLDHAAAGVVFPFGADGLVDRNCALRLPSGQQPQLPWHSVYLGESVAHQSPALFGVSKSQTSSGALADHITDLFESPDWAFRFVPLPRLRELFPRPLSAAQKSVIELTATLATRSLPDDPLLGISPGGGIAPASVTDLSFAFAPDPADTLVGDITWFAERHEPGGVTSEGLTLISAGANARELTLRFEDSLPGEIVLYGSYLTQEGTAVHAPPVVASLVEPEGAAVTAIELVLFPLPDGDTFGIDSTVPVTEVTMAPGETVAPRLIAHYSDGSQQQRYLGGDGVTLTCDLPGVLDVSGATVWLAGEIGSATVTIQAFGQSATLDVIVEDPHPALSFDEWKAQFFSEQELAAPAVSGPDGDLDSDALTNWLEYLTNGNPKAFDQSVAPHVTEIELDGEQRRVIALQTSNDFDVAGIMARRSPDLESWTDLFDLTDNAILTNPRIVDYVETESLRILYLGIEPEMPLEFIRIESELPE